MELQSLAEQVVDDINSTTETQQQVTENITALQDTVDDTFSQIDQACYLIIHPSNPCFTYLFTSHLDPW